METHSGIGVSVLAILLGLYVVVVAVAIWANVRIIKRSGYSGWWVLIGLVPLVNVVMYLVFAFKEAPTERELKQLRTWVGRNPNLGGHHLGG